MKGNQEQPCSCLRKLNQEVGDSGQLCVLQHKLEGNGDLETHCVHRIRPIRGCWSPYPWFIRLLDECKVGGYSQPPPERWGLERWKHKPPSQHGLAQEHDGHWENGRELALTNQLIALLKCAEIHGYPNQCQDCYLENYNYLLSTRDTQVIDIITQFGYVFTLLFQYFDYTHFPELSLLPPHWKIHHSHGNMHIVPDFQVGMKIIKLSQHSAPCPQNLCLIYGSQSSWVPLCELRALLL